MAEKERYITLGHEASAELEEKRSVFIGHAKHITSEQEALDFVKQIKKKYYDARHNVYAYIIGDGSVKKCSDDGEPSKTAGIPIMQMLEGEGVTDVVCVVTRYFGGTLLGTGGLVRAYTLSAKTGLETSGVKVMQSANVYIITVPYSHLSTFEYIAKTHEAAIEDKVYAEDVAAKVSIAEPSAEDFEKELTDKLGTAVKITLSEKTYNYLVNIGVSESNLNTLISLMK